MSVKSFVFAAGLAVLCAGFLAASTVAVEPGHFTVNLNDDCSTDPTNPACSVTDGSGGWGSETLFTDQVNTITSTRGFTASICSDTDANNPNGDEPDCDNDPSIRLNAGGGSISFPPSFNANENGGGIFDFQNNTGAPFTDILFITNFVSGNSYTCASDMFSFCGFQIVQPPNGPTQLEILFINGSIPIASPEPSQYLFLLIAAVAVVVIHRVRSRRVSA